MKKSWTGIGSILIVLVFTVLCLAIFAVISLSNALGNKARTDITVKTVKGYYEADALAECILAEILEAETIPDFIRGVEIIHDTETGTVTFSCPISEKKELYVEVDVLKSTYSILKWCMRDTYGWEADKSLSVWPGD